MNDVESLQRRDGCQAHIRRDEVEIIWDDRGRGQSTSGLDCVQAAQWIRLRLPIAVAEFRRKGED